MARILILGANVWSFEDVKTKEKKEGISIEYISDLPTNDTGKKGYFPIKSVLDLNMLDSLKNFPGIYEVGFGLKPGGKNRQPVLAIEKLDFISKVQFQEVK